MHNNNRKKLKGITIAVVMVIIAVTVFFLVKIARKAPSPECVVTAALIVCAGVLFAVAMGIIYEHSVRNAKERERLEELINRMNSMAILWDPTFSYIKANDIFHTATGYTEEELHDPEVRRKFFPDNAFSSDLQAMIDNRYEEFYITCKDLKKVITIWNTSCIAEFRQRKSDVRIMLSVGKDLTETIRMRKELVTYSDRLRESERKYSLSMGLSDIGLLLKEAGSSRFYASDRLCDMLGLVSVNGYIGGDELREAFHPKDRALFDSFSSGLTAQNESLSADDVHSVDFRAMSAGGSYRWYNFRYRVIPSENGTGVGGAVMDITTDKEKDLIIEKMAYVDDITQIYNRNKFMIMGSELLSEVMFGRDIDYWVIVFDIDNFHFVNDTCGYANGNLLLKEIAAVMTANLTEGGITARIGGDNFALIVKATGDDRFPESLIKRIQSDIARIGGMGLENQNITCSAGYCLMSDADSRDFAQVLDRAEFALSLSVGTKSSILRFDNHAHDAIIAGNAIEKDLIRAVDSNELVLYYQPKINFRTGKVVGMEALIRWIKPDGTVVPPCDFIPVAESSLLITKISQFVLYEACRRNKEWQDMGLEPITVSINLTAIDFYQTNVTENIRNALRETGLDPKWLEVELTESLALKDIDHAINQMNEIKELGVKLSMDDFGTGYSSLSYIQILPISMLKLDRSFIMYLDEDEISREIVSAVIRIAKSKRIETIAEGVETAVQADILKASGCDHAQGFLFGKPMPAEQFEQYIRARQPQRA